MHVITHKNKAMGAPKAIEIQKILSSYVKQKQIHETAPQIAQTQQFIDYFARTTFVWLIWCNGYVLSRKKYIKQRCENSARDLTVIFM